MHWNNQIHFSFPRSTFLIACFQVKIKAIVNVKSMMHVLDVRKLPYTPKTEPFIILAYYAEACIEFAVSNSASWRHGYARSHLRRC